MNPVNGAHTSFTLGKIAIEDWQPNEDNVRDFVAVVSEKTANECRGCATLTYLVIPKKKGNPLFILIHLIA